MDPYPFISTAVMEANGGEALFFLFPIFIAIAIVAMVWQFSTSRSTIEQWAEQQGFQLLSAERRYVRRGPFFLTSSKGQEVFFIAIKDADGQIRHGWARVGGFMIGQFSERVSVRWSD